MNSLALFNQHFAPKPLTEAWNDVVVQDWDVASPGGSFGPGRYVRPATTLYDRTDGRFLPVYQTEFDLACIRAMGRTLAAMSPGLVGALRSMGNYTIGEGFAFTATKEATCGVSDEGAAPVLSAVQREIDYLLDDNEFTSNFDREIHDTSIVDGEVFLCLRPGPDGRVRIRRREPDEFRQPMSTRALEEWIEATHGIPLSEFVPSWSFAVLTRLDTPDEPLGYHSVADESGVNWEFLDVSRVEHIKRNVPRNAKRGFSDFYPIEADSTRGDKLRRNMAEGAAVQSAIAYVRQHVAGTSRVQAESIVGGNRTGTAQIPTQNSTATRNVTRWQPGQVVDLSAGLEYKPGPMGSERAEHFLLVAAYVQRTQAVRWSMPEYMFSGDASNANYASTMEATSPFVKACEAEQRFYSQHFVRMVWKALKIRHACGAFDSLGVSWEELERIVKIRAECPAVATRDPLKALEVLRGEVELGITSLDTAATECGRDLEAEQAKGASPQLATGGVTGESDPTQPNAGAFQGAKRSDFTNNKKATDDILAAFMDGKITEVVAKAYLQRLGWSDTLAQAVLDDAKDGKIDNPLPESLTEERSFSSTQFNLSEGGYSRSQGSPMQAIRQMAAAIDDADLVADGRESEFHVTVKYGIHDETSDSVRKAVGGFGPVEITLGETSVFPGAAGGEYDVVKIDVDGPDLRRLNKLIAESVDCTDTHPTYKPHVTLAYVKRGTGEKYAGNSTVAGMSLTFWDLRFASRSNKVDVISILPPVTPIARETAQQVIEQLEDYP